jgi:hypothetical protein
MVAAVPGSAAIIWDYSPATTGAPYFGEFSNQSAGQNFAEEVSFTTGATLSGIDIYSSELWGDVGDTAQVRIWSDAGGQPRLLLHDFSTIITAEDGVGAVGSETRKHASFSYGLAPGDTYWIGMSGVASELGQIGLLGVDDSSMAQFFGTNFALVNSAGDMAFRLDGELGEPVPEPATLFLLGSGLVGLVARRRRTS